MKSDLISIANAELAEKLRRQEQKDNSSVEDLQSDESIVDPELAAINTSSTAKPRSFKQDIWNAVYVLNLMRYLLGVGLLIFATTDYLRPEWRPLYPWLFMTCTIALLISAVVFTWLSKIKLVNFNYLILLQFATDLVLTTLLVHNFGSIESNFALLMFVVVATGSVVLPKVQALGLASGATILTFYEHLYSVWKSDSLVSPQFGLMVQYGLLLLCCALLVSYLAQRIRLAELKNYVPGDESIEDFLIREEISALRTALTRTHGNKTEAAKLLGMSFRSFRYKLNKYEIS